MGLSDLVPSNHYLLQRPDTNAHRGRHDPKDTDGDRRVDEDEALPPADREV